MFFTSFSVFLEHDKIRKRKMKIKDLFILFFFICITHELQIKKLISKNNEINEIKKQEYIIFGAGALLSSSAYFLENKELTPTEDILKLNKNNINFIDKKFITDYSVNSDNISDITLYTSLALPIIYSLFADYSTEEFINFNFRYAQMQLLNAGITLWTKNLVTRYRPYTYQENLDMKVRRQSDGRNSFYSGHTTIAFGAASYFAYAYELSDNSRLSKNIVWISSIGLASSTGLFRILAGKHFLSEVIIGAAVGTGLGIMFVKQNSQNIFLTNTSKQVENIQIQYFTINFRI